MTLARRVFWDERFARLRAGWRLLAQVVLLIAFLAALGLLARPLGSHVPRDPLDKEVSVALSAAIGLSVLLSVWAAARFVDRRRFADLGFRFSRSWWIDLGFGLALGASLQAGVFLIHMALGWATVTGTMTGSWGGFGFPVSMIAFLLFFAGAAIYEETWNRGYLMKNLAEGLNFNPLGTKRAVWLSAIGTSVIFGLGHATNPGATVASTLAFLPAGLLYAISYALTGELAIPIGYHMAWNLFEGAVFGFPVSGYTVEASILVTRVEGPELWTGATFGPEAGVLGILARAIGILMVVAWVWFRWRKLGPGVELATPALLTHERS